MLKAFILLWAGLFAAYGSTRIVTAYEKPVSPTVHIVALDDTAITFTADDLKKLPRTTVEVTDKSGKKFQYSGVALHLLLEKVNAPLGEELRGEALRCYVSVKAKDEYRVVFALSEFDPLFEDRLILLADERDGQPLDADTGPFQMIVPGEKRRARWVRQVNRIRVMESRVVYEDMPFAER
jgi:hypothetical protein